MTPDRDDALNWDGDDDPTLDVGSARATERPPAPDADPVALPDGFNAVGRGSDEVGRIQSDGTIVMPGDRRGVGNAGLIALGIFGGVYLLYIIGWVIGGLRLQGAARYLVLDVMFQGSLWLAIIAPVLWFATVLLLARRARGWVRFVWLAAGVVLLIPWPFIMVGAVGR